MEEIAFDIDTEVVISEVCLEYGLTRSALIQLVMKDLAMRYREKPMMAKMIIRTLLKKRRVS